MDLDIWLIGHDVHELNVCYISNSLMKITNEVALFLAAFSWLS